jgi:hypothetical protein
MDIKRGGTTVTDKPDDKTPPISELIPSVAGGVSGIASANAPIIFFDEIGAFGTYNGIVHMTLEAMRFMGVGANCVPTAW